MRVAITGLGASSGFGGGVEVLWAGLLDGRRAMSVRPELASLTATPLALSPLVPFDAPQRATQLALAAAREALADAKLGASEARELGIACGTTLGGIGGWLRVVRSSHGGVAIDGPATGAAPRRWSYAGPAQALAEAYDVRGPVQVSSVACASANSAFGLALDRLREGAAEIMLAGGVDALHDFVIAGFGCLKALDGQPCRPFDRSRRGLNLGDGAAFLVLETEAHARRRGAHIRAWLDGFGSSSDAVPMTGPDRQGRGAARAMQAALRDADLAASDVDHVSAHGTATVFNDLMESKAIQLVLGARPVPVVSLKGSVGHTLGASGALEAVAAVRSLETGLIPPTAGLRELDPEIALDVVSGEPRRGALHTVLSTSSGFGGTNAAILLTHA